MNSKNELISTFLLEWFFNDFVVSIITCHTVIYVVYFNSK